MLTNRSFRSNPTLHVKFPEAVVIALDGFRIFRHYMFQRLFHFQVILLAFCLCSQMRAQQEDGSVVLQPRILSPAEFITSDPRGDDARIALPGQVQIHTTLEQDSAYTAALALTVSGAIRFRTSVTEISAMLRLRAEIQRQPSIWEMISRTMNIPTNVLKPTAREITQYSLTIANAMYVPGVLLFPMGTGNVQINLGDVAKIFGIGEDVSPTIRYVVDETTEVEIIIYSTQAINVNTLFKGILAQGAYTLTWNGRDQSGQLLPAGEYIAEVRLGGERIMRKRITTLRH